MSEVLFVSQLPLGRCENLTAVWDAYDGGKSFRRGMESMRSAERDGFDCVVCDCPPTFIDGKSRLKVINLGHGLTGGKLYGLDEGDKPWNDRAAYAQTDYAIASSEAGVPIVARQLGIPEERVLPLGFPRTDAYFEKRLRKRAGAPTTYLYAPTYRHGYGWLPRIDWKEVDALLDHGEEVVVKRHYFTRTPLLDGRLNHVREVRPDIPSAPFLDACDVLLTDYSSILFDAYLMGKPAVLAVDDVGEYLAERGMYHNFPDAYCSRWLRAEGNEGKLVEILRAARVTGMGQTEAECMDLTAGACDGHSTERVCELIRSVLARR